MKKDKVKVKIKKLVNNAVIPTYAKSGDACMDVTAVSIRIVEESGYGYVEYDSGLSFEIPEGYTMLCFPRSSISDTGLILSNSVGIIDSGYRGAVKARFKYIKGSKDYSVGDRIFQIMIIPYPTVEFEEVEELSESSRGAGGGGVAVVIN
jgi:dUTP pyrophosphatase